MKRSLREASPDCNIWTLQRSRFKTQRKNKQLWENQGNQNSDWILDDIKELVWDCDYTREKKVSLCLVDKQIEPYTRLVSPGAKAEVLEQRPLGWESGALG